MRRVKEAIQAAPKGVLPEIHTRRMSLIDGFTCNSRVISVPFRCSFRHALVKCNHSVARTVPYSDPPSSKDVNQLHEFIGRRWEFWIKTEVWSQVYRHFLYILFFTVKDLMLSYFRSHYWLITSVASSWSWQELELVQSLASLTTEGNINYIDI